MSKAPKQEIKCLNCGKWFKNNAIVFSSVNGFNSSELKNNLVQCPYCNKMTGCDKENIRITGESEGFIGKDTV